MNLSLSMILASPNTLTHLKEPKGKYNMDGVQGGFLGPLHDTASAAAIAN